MNGETAVHSVHLVHSVHSPILNPQSPIPNPKSEISQMNPDLSPLSPILLTGATTHTGRRLARRLLECGAALRCLVHTTAHRGRLPEHARLEVVTGSADSPADLHRALGGVATVIHLAGHRFTPGLVAALASQAPREFRLLVQSSTRLFSRFETPTRASVEHAEGAVCGAPRTVRWTILRPAMIFGGPEDNNLQRVANALRRWRVFPLIGGGRNLVQPLFVWDLVAAHVAALQRPESQGQAYTLAGPEAVAYRAMIEAVARAAGLPRPLFVPLPIAPLLLAARLACGVWRRSPLHPEMVERFAEDKAFDIAPARRDLGFAPTPLDEALARKFRGEV